VSFDGKEMKLWTRLCAPCHVVILILIFCCSVQSHRPFTLFEYLHRPEGWKEGSDRAGLSTERKSATSLIV
jgi:hypothetical protein